MKGAMKMKKNNLTTGFLYVFAGIIFLLFAVLTDSNLNSLFFGFAGAGIVPGLMMIYKYYYWNKPQNKERYQEKIANEMIELHDELKVKLRDKSGRYAYVLGLIITSASIVMFSILEKIQTINESRIIVIYLSVYLLFQLVIGNIIYKHLLKKY